MAKDCVHALRLSERLGPVAAVTFRVASRIANSLRAGSAVKGYGDLDGCDTIVVAVPDSTIGKTVAALRGSGVRWRGVSALLYSARCGSDELQELQQEGAGVASLRAVGAADRWFLVEGDAGAVRRARRLVHDADGRTVEVERGAAAAYLAAVSFSSSLFVPLIEATLATLRLAGASPQEASSIGAMLFERSLRAHRHGGRKSWTGPLAMGDGEEVRKEAAALTVRDPSLGRYYEASSMLALQLMKELRERTR